MEILFFMIEIRYKSKRTDEKIQTFLNSQQAFNAANALCKKYAKGHLFHWIVDGAIGFYMELKHKNQVKVRTSNFNLDFKVTDLELWQKTNGRGLDAVIEPLPEKPKKMLRSQRFFNNP